MSKSSSLPSLLVVCFLLEVMNIFKSAACPIPLKLARPGDKDVLLNVSYLHSEVDLTHHGVAQLVPSYVVAKVHEGTASTIDVLQGSGRLTSWLYFEEDSSETIPHSLTRTAYTASNTIYVHPHTNQQNKSYITCQPNALQITINRLECRNCVKGNETWTFAPRRVNVGFTCIRKLD